MVQEGLKPLLEQVRISMQAVPWHCVQQQHWVNYLSQSGMLQELAGPAVRKAGSLSCSQKNRPSQGDEDKNCSQLSPGQTKSGTHSVQEGLVWHREAGNGLAAVPSSALGDLKSTSDRRTQTGDARRRDGSTPNEGGDQKWTSPLMMVPQVSGLEIPIWQKSCLWISHSPLQYFYVAVTEASSSCVCKTAKVNFYQVPTTKTYTGTTTKEDKNYI